MISRSFGIRPAVKSAARRSEILRCRKFLTLPTESLPTEQFVYVPVSSTSIQLGLYVTGAGWSEVARGESYPHKGHPDLYDFTWRSGRVLPEFQFVFISSGSGEFETRETGRLKVKAGAMLILQPDTWHRYRPMKKEGWTEFWISVNGDLIHDWQNRGLLNTDNPLIHLQRPEVLILQYQEIINSLKERTRQLPTSIAAHALMIITAAIDHHAASNVGSSQRHLKDYSPTVSAAIYEIWNHSHQQISVAAIARRLNVVRRTLERLFLKETGHSVHDELMNCRLERAKRLLLETQTSIKSVAYAAGFSSVSNMSRVFRRELNITPSEYRRTIHASHTDPIRRIVSD